MEIRHLEHFVAVAEEGHFNRAAARCHIVRSGLSASIRALEKELGTPLFVRTTREVRLTPAGLALLAEARRVLASIDAARNAVTGVSGLLRGTLRLAVSHANRAADVPAVIAAFRRAHPDMAISVTAGVWRDIVADINTGAIDIGLAYLPSELPPHTHYERLASGSMVLVCSRDHSFANRTEVALSELRDETIIAVPASSVRRTMVDEALEDAGVDRPFRIDVARLGFLLEMVRVGLGVGIVPGPDAGGPSAELVRLGDLDTTSTFNGHAPVCWVPIREPSPRWTYAVITASPELRTAAAQAFLQLLRQDRAASADPATDTAVPIGR